MKNMTQVALIICLAVVVLMTCLLTGCSSTDLENGIIMEGVSVAGVDVGGMSKEDAVSAVRLATADTYTQNSLVIHILDDTIELTPELTGISLDAEAAVEAAYALGRSGSKEEREALQQQAMTTGIQADISGCLNLSKEDLFALLQKLCENYTTTSLCDASYEITGEMPDLTAEEAPEAAQTLVITMGTPEFQFDLEELCAQVMDAYQANVFEMEYLCQMTEPKEIDLDAIYAENLVEVKEPEMDKETFEVSDHSYGYCFDLEAAKEAVSKAAYGETVEIPFVITAPTQTKEALASLLFRDVLATSSAYSASSYNRQTNLRLACEALNGTVLLPGEKLSYNNALGERTPEKGWKPAGTYVGGETIDTYGGGICQPSSVLYYCTLLADLEIVHRACHQYMPSYVDPGMDATVYWGGVDFIFANNTDYPIRIDAVADGSKVTISLVGTDTKDYYIDMEYEIVGVRGWEDEIVEIDPNNNPKGYSDGEVISSPYTGYTVVTYKCRYSKDDDSLIERVKEDDSYYSSRNRKTVKFINNEPEETDPTEPPTEPTTPPATEPSAPPATEPTTPPASEPTAPPATEPPATEPPATEPPATEPPASPATDPPAAPSIEPGT